MFEIRHNPDSLAGKGLLKWWTWATGTKERDNDLVEGTHFQRIGANEIPNLIEITPDGILIPHLIFSGINGTYFGTSAFNMLNLVGTRPFTIMIWCYPTTSGDEALFFNSGADPRFYFTFRNTSQLFIGMGDSFDNTMSTYASNKWQLVTLSFDGTTWQTTLDGFNVSNASFSGTKTLGSTAEFALGKNGGTFGSYTGKVGPFSIHDYALTAEQIRQIRYDYWRSFLGEIPSGRINASYWLGTARIEANLIVHEEGPQKNVEADIIGSATVTANLTRQTQNLETDIIGDATVTADLIRTVDLSNDIVGNATVTANLERKVTINLFDGIAASGTVDAIFSSNVTHTDDTLIFSDETAAFNVHGGSTLVDLKQTLAIELILNIDLSDTINLTDITTKTHVYNKSLLTELDALQQFITPNRSFLKSTSTHLFLLDSAVPSRPAISVLNLTQSASGIIFFLPGITDNVLNLIDSAETNLFANFTINFNGTANVTATLSQILNRSVVDTLNLQQQALSVVLKTKKYVILQAPFDFLQTSIVLPAPLWGDGENLISTMSLRRSMNGNTTTYVKTNNSRRLTYTFRLLDRLKAVELGEFVKYYNSDALRLTNWKGEVWKVYFANNPFDFVKTGRERTDISLEFEGTKLYG